MSGLPPNISTAIDALIRREGGDRITDDPYDTGGLTKFGISKAAWPNVDIAALTLDEARRLYYERYYLAPRFHLLPLEYSEPVFDLGVHAGPAQAIRLMQRTVGVKADGVIGDETIAAVQRQPVAGFRKAFAVERLLFYVQTIVARPSNLKFARGWLRRALEFI